MPVPSPLNSVSIEVRACNVRLTPWCNVFEVPWYELTTRGSSGILTPASRLEDFLGPLWVTVSITAAPAGNTAMSIASCGVRPLPIMRWDVRRLCLDIQRLCCCEGGGEVFSGRVGLFFFSGFSCFVSVFFTRVGFFFPGPGCFGKVRAGDGGGFVIQPNPTHTHSRTLTLSHSHTPTHTSTHPYTHSHSRTLTPSHAHTHITLTPRVEARRMRARRVGARRVGARNLEKVEP